nr:phage terminase large subunit family protein [Roseomonas acroporae]
MAAAGRIARRWAPPPRLTVSEWADRFRFLSAEASAEPGKWSTGRAEYQRGIMDAISDPTVETVVVMSSAQVGKTEFGLNLVGFHVHQDPAPILVLQPSIEMGEAWSKDRLAPMLRDSACFRGRVSDPKSRDGTNGLRHKVFPGGHITIAGANSPASLASRPIRVLFCDEVDRYPPSAGAEGDPVALARKRTTTFWNRKVVLVSTPTIAGSSRIETAWRQSDRRRFWVSCPHCDRPQTLKWAQVRWDRDDPESAAYHCEACGAGWSDAERWRAVTRGEWRAEAPGVAAAGFHLSELYSPWRRLAETAADFLAAKDRPETLRVWINTALGEPWEERGEAPPWRRLYDRREDRPPGIVPNGGLVLTGGIDVQKSPGRLECFAWAWGRDRQSWLVEHHVIHGNPYESAVWAAATEWVQQTWRHEAGAELRLARCAVDTGFATLQAEAWARRHPALVVPVKGASTLAAPVFAWSSVREAAARGGPRKRGQRLGLVGGHVITLELYGLLNLDPPTDAERAAGCPYPAGYVHLSTEASEEFCKQLVGDQWIEAKGEWKQAHATEALDGWKYARAMHSLVGLDRWRPAQWATLADELGLPLDATPEAPEPAPDGDGPPPAAPPEPPPAPQKPRMPIRRVGRSSYMSRLGR